MPYSGTPLAHGKLEILSAPGNFVGREATGVFGREGTVAVGVALVGGPYGLISLTPALHLTYSFGDEPVVVIDGTRQRFQGRGLTLLGPGMGLEQREIVVSGRHRFYRVTVRLDDVREFWLLPTHRRVGLAPLGLRRNPVAATYDAGHRELASCRYGYWEDRNFATQCGQSALRKLFPQNPRGCVALLRSIVADMAAKPDARFLDSSAGSGVDAARLYECNDGLGPSSASRSRSRKRLRNSRTTPPRR